MRNGLKTAPPQGGEIVKRLHFLGVVPGPPTRNRLIAALRNRAVTRQSPSLKSLRKVVTQTMLSRHFAVRHSIGLGTNAHSLLCYQYLLARSSYCTRGRRSRLRAEAYRFYQDRTAIGRIPQSELKGACSSDGNASRNLTDTPAMLAFIAQSFPDAALAPLNDVFAFAELQSFNSYMCSTLHVAHAHRMRGYRWNCFQNFVRVHRIFRHPDQANLRHEKQNITVWEVRSGGGFVLIVGYIAPRLFVPQIRSIHRNVLSSYACIWYCANALTDGAI